MTGYSDYGDEVFLGADAAVGPIGDHAFDEDAEPYGRPEPDEASWFARRGRRGGAVERTEREVLALVNELLGR